MTTLAQADPVSEKIAIGAVCLLVAIVIGAIRARNKPAPLIPPDLEKGLQGDDEAMERFLQANAPPGIKVTYGESKRRDTKAPAPAPTLPKVPDRMS
jgi:hypothetical protein